MTLSCTEVEQAPATGVKVYMPVAIFETDVGLQDPEMLLVEVTGRAGATEP